MNRVTKRRLGLRFWAWYWGKTVIGRVRGWLGLCKHAVHMAGTDTGFVTVCADCKKVMPPHQQMCGRLP